MWCIYTLSDPRTGGVRYVGESITGAGRLESHIGESRSFAARTRPRLTDKHIWLLGLQASGLAPTLAVVDTYPGEATKGARMGVERQWIEAYAEAGADLVNVIGHPTRASAKAAEAWERTRNSAARVSARRGVAARGRARRLSRS